MNIISGIVLVCLTLIGASGKKIKPRVLSSKFSPDIHYPFQATVIFGRKFVCSATLITSKQLLTVASSVAHLMHADVLPTVKVRVGSIRKLDGTGCRVKRISHHANFSKIDDDFYINNIAVIHTLFHVALSEKVQPAALPAPHSDLPEKVLVLFSSWSGRRKSDSRLAPLLMRILTNSETRDVCQFYFPSHILNSGQVCIEIDPSFRYVSVDAGGPLLDIAETTILALGSSGYERNGCNDIPKIFTKVSEYIPYIINELSYDTILFSTEYQSPDINFG